MIEKGKKCDIRDVNAMRTPRERVEAARKAGKASGKARRAAKTLRELAHEVGEEAVPKQVTLTKAKAAVEGMYREAAKGNPAAFSQLLRARGEDVQRVEVEGGVPITILEDGLGE